jgi:hypothetical protein
MCNPWRKMSENIPDITILVQSTDSFSDCWVPFFSLLKRFWPDCRHKIFLNTESKSFSFPGLDIQSTQIIDRFDGKWPTWSETLQACLDMVSSEIILFFIDDLFISRRVETMALQHYMRLMSEKGYSNITLTEHGHKRPRCGKKRPS